MSVPTNFEGNCEPSLMNAAQTRNLSEGPSFRNPIPSTSTGITGLGPPTLPPRPDMSVQPSYGMNSFGMNSFGMNSYGSYGMGGYGGGYGGYGGFGNYGMGGMGGFGGMGYGGYNRFGPMDIESRFIQVAEERSRPAFDSIQSVVHAVGSVAMMLENTFFALTSSFRAILGVAENFGRLRSLFAQAWSSFAVFRTLNWIVRKLLVILGIRTESEFKAWAEAVQATQAGSATPEQRAKGSSWPILLFFGVIAAAPYIILKMLNGLTNSIHERLNDPTTWQNPLRAIAQHEFHASSPQEISFNTNQLLTIAPQQLQGQMWNSGWLMASADRQTAGLVPVNYIKIIKPNTENQKVDPNVDFSYGNTNANFGNASGQISNNNVNIGNTSTLGNMNSNISNSSVNFGNTNDNIGNASAHFGNTNDNISNATVNNGNANIFNGNTVPAPEFEIPSQKDSPPELNKFYHEEL